MVEPGWVTSVYEHIQVTFCPPLFPALDLRSHWVRKIVASSSMIFHDV